METDSTEIAGTAALAGAGSGRGGTGEPSAVIAALRDRSPGPPRCAGPAPRPVRTPPAERGTDRWYGIAAGGRAAVAEAVRGEAVTAGRPGAPTTYRLSHQDVV
ncbi:hypothetical protein ACH4FE_37255 [Streptomyces celluloflavus]|uniref:hypothetical protein n=1 Tax=Streptomyces celluloflavus TaxID=58344 RepID=UPI0037B196EB